MTHLAFDAANPAIDIDTMIKHGAIVAPVYIRGTPGGFQPSDAKRVTALRKAGLAPWPNWEAQADYFAHASLDDARWAGKDARNACLRLGFPDDGSISVPFSFDYQLPKAKFADARDLLMACQDGLGDGFLATSYSQSALIRYLGGHGFGHTGHWLMASTWGLSDYAVSFPFVCMVQSHDANGDWLDSPIAGTDVNTVTRPEKLRAWWPDKSPYHPSSPMHPDWSDTLTKDELEKLIDERAKAQAEQLVSAAIFGGNATLHKHRPGLYPTAGDGITDRLLRLEKAVKT